MDKIDLIPDIFKDHKLCWYPSAGSDFQSINFWKEMKGNVNDPTLFIFTDIAYNGLEPGRIIHFDSNYWYFIKRNYPNGMVYPKISGLPMFSNFDDCRNYMNLNKELLLKIISASFTEKYNIWSLRIDNDITDFAEDLGLTISRDTTGILCEHKNNNTHLLLLNMYNQAFYNYCVSNSVSIPCLIVRRPLDNFIYDKKLSLKKLKTRELCILDNDCWHFDFPEKYRKFEEFIWDSGDTYEDAANFIAFQD